MLGKGRSEAEFWFASRIPVTMKTPVQIKVRRMPSQGHR